ncbi:hypothetical protein FJU08_17210 [Martelella alba]|uniref:Uncharacterized protein n=1 Tax=Martelella alba TaxID=2590451 RepID=A0A506U6E9_9HYPH|nr:hypothetical protein [Martelella alba]TPW28545.1 hypothetical protein FJU08_17210 [Martelella alba]
MSGLFFLPYATSAAGVLIGVYLTTGKYKYNRTDYILRAGLIFVVNLVISYLLDFAFPLESAVGGTGLALSTAYYVGLSAYAIIPGLAFGRFTVFRANDMGHHKDICYLSAIPFFFIYFMLFAHRRDAESNAPHKLGKV